MIAGLLLAFAAAHCVTVAHLPRGPGAAKPDQHAQNQQAAAEPGATIPGDQNKPRAYDPNCPYPKDREDADLCEQRRMSKAAEETAALADAQFIWNVAQALATIVAAFATALAAIYAGVAATAANRSAKLAEHAIHRLERPYLFFQVKSDFNLHAMVTGDDGYSRQTVATHPRVEFYFGNYGRVPAAITVLGFNFDHLAMVPDDTWEVRDHDAFRNEVVEPGKQTRTFTGTLDHTVDDAMRDSIVAGKSFLWLYGFLEYEAPTGEKYATHFCWRYDGIALSFEPYHQQYNYRT